MKTPLHLWVVGVLSLVWNAGGAMDYALTKLEVTAYTQNMPPAMRDLLAGYPVWMTAVWALAVWMPLLGAVALLSRRRGAVAAYWLGLVFVLVAGVYNYVISDPSLSAVAGQGVFYFWLVVILLAVMQWLYARTMAGRGVLT